MKTQIIIKIFIIILILTNIYIIKNHIKKREKITLAEISTSYEKMNAIIDNFKQEKDLNSLENKVLKETINSKIWIIYVHEDDIKKGKYIASTNIDGKDYCVYFKIIDHEVFYRIEEVNLNDNKF